MQSSCSGVSGTGTDTRTWYQNPQETPANGLHIAGTTYQYSRWSAGRDDQHSWGAP